LLKFCYVPATSTTSSKALLAFFIFWLWPITVLKRQPRQAVHAVDQSIFLRCLWIGYKTLFKAAMETSNCPFCWWFKFFCLTHAQHSKEEYLGDAWLVYFHFLSKILTSDVRSNLRSRSTKIWPFSDDVTDDVSGIKSETGFAQWPVL